MTPATPPDLLELFHRQVRLGAGEGDARTTREQVGLVVRVVSSDPADPWAMVESPAGLGPVPDAVIAGERDHFAGLGVPLEWKTYSYDDPPDLGARLERAGFTKEPDEALLLGELAPLAQAVLLPDGVTIREVRTRGDARRVQALYDVVWAGAWGRTDPDDSRDDELLEGRGEGEYAVLAERSVGGPVLCAARVNLAPATDFAGMWGGSTHPDWRRRGLFRAVLAERARWALEHGAAFARVDASAESEPILHALGLQRVATTTPYKHGGGRAGG